MASRLNHHLTAAQEAVEAERERSRREREALEAFRERVAALDAEPMQSQSVWAAGPLAVQSTRCTRGAPVEAVWTAYQETVIALGHFEQAYLETPAEHIAAELGEDVAAIVTEAGRLTEFLKQIITTRVQPALDQRAEVIAVTNAEERAIENARALVGSVKSELCQDSPDTSDKRPLDSSFDVVDGTDTIVERCDRLLKSRQRTLDEQTQPQHLETDRERWVGYLYRDLPVTYPILDAITRLRSIIGTQDDSPPSDRYALDF